MKLITFAALALMLSSACSTLSVNKAELANVKSAALVGFGADISALQPRDEGSNRGVMGTINAVNKIRKMSDGRSFEERHAQADGSYRLFVERLAKDLGWKVLSATETSSNAEYTTEYQNRTAKKWMASTTEALGSKLYVKGIMWDQDAQRLSAEDRARLMEALGVDAIAIATVELKVGKTTGFGRYTRYPAAVIKLAVYDRSHPDPIWSDRYAPGDSASQGITETMGFASTADATPIVLEAVQLGLDALMQRYREAEGG